MTAKVSNADAISGELGLSKTDEGDDAKYPEGAVKSIIYTLTEKKIDKREIQVEGSNDMYTVTQTKTEKATE